MELTQEQSDFRQRRREARQRGELVGVPHVPPPAKQPPAVSGECVHLGTELPRAEWASKACASCRGENPKLIEYRTFACDVFGKCTMTVQLDGVGCCKGCGKYEAKGPPKPPTRDDSACYVTLPDFPPVTVRHLLCHIYPTINNDAWRATVDRLKQSMGLFNGRRVVAVVTGNETHSAEVVTESFGDYAYDIKFIEATNDPKLREVVTLIPLLSNVESLQPNEATFYCHGKGTRHGAESTCHRWREVMYDTCLNWHLVAKTLKRFPIVGTFKKIGHAFRDQPNLSTSDWHYSGTFWWFRNAELFKRNWRHVDQIPWGSEPYPSLMFSPREAAALLLEGSRVEMDLYKQDYWKTTIEPLVKLYESAP